MVRQGQEKTGHFNSGIHLVKKDTHHPVILNVMQNKTNQYSIIPNGMFTWNSTMKNQENLIKFGFNWRNEKGTISINDSLKLQIAKGSMFKGEWALINQSNTIATAKKPSAFTREFEISMGSRLFKLITKSKASRCFYLESAGERLMEISPKNIFTRKANVTCNETLTLELLSFSCWLTIMSWRRSAYNNS